MTALIDTLLAQTRAGAISWKQTDLPGAFAYVARQGSVIVRVPRRRPDLSLSAVMNDTSGASIQVLDAKGDRVESYEESAFNGAAPYEALSALCREIAQRYSEGDPLLDDLRHEVEAAGRR